MTDILNQNYLAALLQKRDEPGYLPGPYEETPQWEPERPRASLLRELANYPEMLLRRSGVLWGIDPAKDAMFPPQGQRVMGAIQRLGTYTPGPRESTNVEDRRPKSIWEWPR